MRNAIVFGALLAISATTAGYAQSAAPAAAAAATGIPIDLEPHLKSGAAIFDLTGKQVGSIASVDKDHAAILIHESSFMGGSSILRIMPVETVSWTNGKLQTTIPAKQIGKLKSG